jgi:hypothetical protein
LAVLKAVAIGHPTVDVVGAVRVYTGTAGLADSVENSGADLYLMKGPDPRSTLDEVADHVARRRG